MKLGYNTNGLAHHEPIQALNLLSEIGYQSVAITIDHAWLAPTSRHRDEQLEQIRDCLTTHQLRSVIESGARFLLDPHRKHHPTLVDPDNSLSRKRIDYLKYCIDTAIELGSDCVSLWSGQQLAGVDDQETLDTLGKNLKEILQYA